MKCYERIDCFMNDEPWPDEPLDKWDPRPAFGRDRLASGFLNAGAAFGTATAAINGINVAFKSASFVEALTAAQAGIEAATQAALSGALIRMPNFSNPHIRVGDEINIGNSNGKTTRAIVHKVEDGGDTVQVRFI